MWLAAAMVWSISDKKNATMVTKLTTIPVSIRAEWHAAAMVYEVLAKNVMMATPMTLMPAQMVVVRRAAAMAYASLARLAMMGTESMSMRARTRVR